jgi:hypothetical protein
MQPNVSVVHFIQNQVGHYFTKRIKERGLSLEGVGIKVIVTQLQ